MIEIRHEGRGPYVERTIVEWHGPMTIGEAESMAERIETARENEPETIEDLRSDLARAEHDLSEAENERDEHEERADAAEAELARIKGDVCGMCSRTHANEVGICRRHGKPIQGFDLADEFRALLARYEDMRSKHEEASREVVQARAEVAALKRRKRTAA